MARLWEKMDSLQAQVRAIEEQVDANVADVHAFVAEVAQLTAELIRMTRAAGMLTEVEAGEPSVRARGEGTAPGRLERCAVRSNHACTLRLTSLCARAPPLGYAARRLLQLSALQELRVTMDEARGLMQARCPLHRRTKRKAGRQLSRCCAVHPPPNRSGLRWSSCSCSRHTSPGALTLQR